MSCKSHPKQNDGRDFFQEDFVQFRQHHNNFWRGALD